MVLHLGGVGIGIHHHFAVAAHHRNASARGPCQIAHAVRIQTAGLFHAQCQNPRFARKLRGEVLDVAVARHFGGKIIHHHQRQQ